MSKGNVTLTVLGVFGVILLIGIPTLLFRMLTTVEPGTRGVVVTLGEVTRVLEDGFHVVNPFTESVKILPIRIAKFELETSAASKDLQTVTTTVVVNYALDPNAIQSLYEQIGMDYGDQIIRPAIHESVKSATALFTAEELISKRTEVKDKMLVSLKDRLAKFYITVSDVSIVNFTFSEGFDQSIEAKQVAEQKALQAENDLKRVQLEAQQQIERAKAEAESTRLQVEALKQGSQVVELRKAEAMLELAKKWNGGMPTTLIVGEGGALPLLNVQ